MGSKKKLFKSKKNRIISGVFGGLEDYSGTDAIILRFLFIIISVFTGFIPGLISYFVAVLIIPEK